MHARLVALGKTLAALGLAAAAACSRPLSTRFFDPGPVHEDSGSFPVGEVGSFSGPDAERALAFHRGFQRAIEQCNAQGGIHGRTIELQVLDDRGRAEEARLGAERLAMRIGAVAIACVSDANGQKALLEGARGVPVVLGRSVIPEQERGYEAGDRLCRALARATRILPKEVGQALASERQ